MHPKLRQVARLAVVFTVLVLVCQTVAMGCPTCKDGLASSDPEQANLVRGYFWSIVFMMSMPFLILGGLGTYFYLMIRRNHALQPQVALVSAEHMLGSERVTAAS